MIDILSRRKQTKEPTTPIETLVQRPVYTESAILPRSTVAFKRNLSFHLDQSGIQLGCSAQFGKSSKLLDARKLYFPASNESHHAPVTFITDSIQNYIREFGSRQTDIVLSVSGEETAFRTFNMPELAKNQLASAVRFEAKRQVPFPLTDCQFDFRPVARIENDGKVSLKVALHAATNRTIEERLAPFRVLGYDVSHVYHTHDVIGQLLKFLPDFAEDRYYTLINVERTRTEISYYCGSKLEFYHNCSIGSSFLARRSDPTIFEYFAESLSGEIQNSLDFYTGQFSGQFATRIYIHGDLAYSSDLVELLHNRFGYEFRRFPTESLQIAVDGNRGKLEEMSVCLPVLASTICAVDLANLLPVEQRQKAQARRIERMAITGVIALAGLLLVLWATAALRTTSTEARLKNLNGEIAGFQRSTLFDTYNLVKREIVAGTAYLEKIEPTPSHLALALKELSNLTPAGVELSNLNYQTGEPSQNLTMDGIVASSSIPPEVILAEYVANLQRSPFFDSVTVLRYTKRTADGRFILNFSMNMRGLL